MLLAIGKRERRESPEPEQAQQAQKHAVAANERKRARHVRGEGAVVICWQRFPDLKPNALQFSGPAAIRTAAVSGLACWIGPVVGYLASR